MDPKAKYLVLRLDGKPHNSAERYALQAYLLALDEDGKRALADHLRSFFGVADDPLMTLSEDTL